jgi:hypothetical protein
LNSQEATLAVIDALDGLGVPYMLVGSFSSNFYGIPRSTKDADFVVQLGGVPVAELMKRLGPDFQLDPQLSFESVTGTTRCQIRLVQSPFEIELFLLSDDPHDQERFRRRCRVPLSDREIFMPTAEDVLVTKLRWLHLTQRSKDRDDVRNILAVQGDGLDWAYIHHWCDQHGTRERLEEIRRSIPPL